MHTVNVILFETDRKNWIFENTQMCVDKATEQNKSYMRMAALSDKGKKSCYDGNGGDRLNTAVCLLIPQYGGDAVIVAALHM